MRMTLVFTTFAILAFLARCLLPHLAAGLGIDMMLVYLALAVLSALLTLLRRRGTKDGSAKDGSARDDSADD